MTAVDPEVPGNTAFAARGDDPPRPPAEWSRHEACWLAWPSHREEWGAALPACRRAFAALCAAIADPDPATGRARGERLEILVLDEAGEREARAALTGVPARIHRIPFGDIWLRDTGPVFVASRGGRRAAVRFRWTGWGGKYPFPDDAGVAARVAERAGAPGRWPVRGSGGGHDLALEGGAIDTDGDGTVLTTRQCLLAASRNPGWSERDVEAALARSIGAERVVWLDRGLVGDHTDGHVDTLARFVAPGRVACMEPAGAADPNADALRDIARALEAARDARGRRLEVVRIPSPGAVTGADGDLAPASYLNFYVGNRAVVIPVYGASGDDRAARAIADLFPDRRATALDATAVLTGGGAFHCITRDQPGEEEP